ncbi:tyrosine-type recombinase/integrase [Wenyingzhuangia sp. IMCC45574]
MKKNITLKRTIHKDQEIVCIIFPYDAILLKQIRIMNTRWSKTLKCWYIPLDDFVLHTFFQKMKNYAHINYEQLKNHQKQSKRTSSPLKSTKSQLNDSQKRILNEFYSYLRGKRYSKSTLDTYTYLIADFLVFNREIEIKVKRSIELFVEKVYVPKKIAISTHRQFISAMNHYLTFTKAGFLLDFNIDAPKKDTKLPNVLSKEEIIRLIQVTKNLKHRLCITLLYSSGLRIGELLSLQLKDIDFDRKLIRIEMAKGRKDRYVPLANSILPMLHNYITTYSPKKYLIENHYEHKQYKSSSVRHFLKKSCIAANIQKHVTPHTLRHSYGTHLLESGTDIRYIQQFLGHSNPKTTMIYTHVQSEALQKIKNPLDLIVAQLNNQKKIG